MAAEGFLSVEAFEEACHHLDRRYRQARLGALRLCWKLRMRTILHNGGFSFYNMPRTIVEITRPLERNEESLDLNLDALSLSNESNATPVEDHEMIENEEPGEVALRPGNFHQERGYVTYDIVLHPTYQVPCLYFRLWGLPHDESPFDPDTVFRYLVPDKYKDSLRSSFGGVGGISVDHHPLYGERSFFVHPCHTADIMAAWQCAREDYLTIWLGMAGACVGLSVPREMMLS